jgi:hypothetical protein
MLTGSVIGMGVLIGLAAAVSLTLRGVRRTEDECHEALLEPDAAGPLAGRPTLNVELPAPSSGRGFALTCPHCGCELPLEDLSLIGETVECPACELLFLVLEPERLK